MTTWDPANKDASITLSNANLTAQGGWASALVYATVGVAANDPGDHSFTLTLNANLGGSMDYGLAIAGQATNSRIGLYDPTTHLAMNASMLQDCRFFTVGYASVLAGLTGGIPLVVGDIIQFRMKAGFLYVRYSNAGFTYGPWNGIEGIYAGANADAGTGGIPLSAFGSALLYPYMYLEGDTVTADFTAWSGAASIISGAGNGAGVGLQTGVGAGRFAGVGAATGTGNASAGTGSPPSTQSGAGSAPGMSFANGRNGAAGALSAFLRTDQLAFHVTSGLGIAYPFLFPTGTDTGVISTSHYDTSPYLDPSNFATHVGSWLTNQAAALGYDHIRLHVNPGPIIECNNLNQTSRKATLLGEISAAVDLILAAGLKCIINLQLTGFPTGFAVTDFLDSAGGVNFAKYKLALQDFANKFKTYSQELVALELIHEPPLSTEFTSAPAVIPPGAILISDSNTLYTTMRDPTAGGKVYLLAGNTNFGTFYFPPCDFRTNPIRIIGQAGTVFGQLGTGGANGITFENIKAMGDPANGTCFAIGGCDSITLINCIADSGGAPGAPIGQGYSIRNATNINIVGQGDASISDIKNCDNGLAVIGPTNNVLIKNITITNGGVDGIICGGSVDGSVNNTTIDGVLGTDFHSGVGDHPDFIQFFGPNNGNIVRNCGWYRGNGTEAQGIFLGNPTNFTVQHNWIYGAMYNSISVASGATVLIDDNYLIGDATYGSWIIVRGATSDATLTNNYAGAFINYAAEGINPNFQPAVLPGSNTIIGTVNLGDYTSLDAWIATHPTTRKRTGTAVVSTYYDMLTAMYGLVRPIMPNHTLILTSAGYSAPSALTVLDPSAFDKNVLWAFHLYPLSSVQGAIAGRGNLSSKYLQNYDWEKHPEERPAILTQVSAAVNADPAVAAGNKTAQITATMTDVDTMFTRGRDYIETQLASVATWASTNSVSVICTEYGVAGSHSS